MYMHARALVPFCTHISGHQLKYIVYLECFRRHCPCELTISSLALWGLCCANGDIFSDSELHEPYVQNPDPSSITLPLFIIKNLYYRKSLNIFITYGSNTLLIDIISPLKWLLCSGYLKTLKTFVKYTFCIVKHL